jgi:alkylation response protein AidB-like acyl-CoA dehydrogenase
VGPVNGGWKVAMGTLAYERGASTLGQQLAFVAEFERVCEVAKQTGADKQPLIRDRIAELWIRLKVMRLNALRILSAHNEGAPPPREAYITKLYWATWHRDLGELAMDVLNCSSAVVDEQYEDLHTLFLWSRSDTIYAGTNQIQRNIIAQRALGLPR